MCWRFVPILFLALKVRGNSNNNFNASLRDYSVVEDANTTHVRTLQAEGPKNYPKFGLHRGPFLRQKEFPDSAISSSSHSHSRGLHHDPGYEATDYDDSPHGYYGAPYGVHYDPGHYSHFPHDHNHDHHLDYHHHKHYDPGLKAILLPVAGLAILGAAAALVTNPVLLQLGVVSGRRRRDTAADNKLIERLLDPVPYEHKEANRKTETPMNSGAKIRRHPGLPLTARVSKHNSDDDFNFVPIPLKLRDRRILIN